MVELNGFAGVDRLTVEHMHNYFVVLWDDGELGLAIKVLMHIHLESDSVCAAVDWAVNGHPVLVEPLLIGLILRNNMSELEETDRVGK
jgi:hypothetical protein